MKNTENMSPCLWSRKLEDDFFNEHCYHTSCDIVYYFGSGYFKDETFKFCPYCGGHIVDVKED